MIMHTIAEPVYEQLSERGWSVIPRPVDIASLDALVADFEGLVEELGRETLAHLTYENVTGRRGGEYGFVRRVDRIESKDAFMLRSVEPEYDTTVMPGSLVEFMRNGREIVHESQLAFEGLLSALDAFDPGIFDTHFVDHNQVDTSVRVVISDNALENIAVVAEPHKDISTCTMHLKSTRPGTFFVIQPDGKIVFPSGGGSEATLFTGCGVKACNPASHLTPVYHGAVNGQSTEGEKRGVVVAQIQPNLAVNISPTTYEETHIAAHEIDGLLQQISDAYAKTLS